MEKKYSRVTLRLERDFFKFLTHLCVEKGITKHAAFMEAIHAWIECNKE